MFCMSDIGRRYLFSTEYLGIENYKRERMEAAERFGGSKGLCSEYAENHNVTMQYSPTLPVYCSIELIAECNACLLYYFDSALL